MKVPSLPHIHVAQVRTLAWCAIVALSAVLAKTESVRGNDIPRIWSPRLGSQEVTAADHECYFRKKFTLIRPESAEIILSAADGYELYVNGKRVGAGLSAGETVRLDATRWVEPGVNLIAIKVQHFESSEPWLAMKFRVKERGEVRWRSLVTDESWKTRISYAPAWSSLRFNDLSWIPAAIVPGETGTAVGAQKPNGQFRSASTAAQTPPIVSGSSSSRVPSQRDGNARVRMGDVATGLQAASPQAGPARQAQRDVAETGDPDNTAGARFQCPEGFVVQQVMTPEETGSLLAMAFDEFGRLLLSREQGPLMVARHMVRPEDPERIRLLCDEVSSCQGILPLNGEVYVTAMGPQGMGLYRLGNLDDNGQLHIVQTLLRFTGRPGEHGPHGLALGPDGMIYCTIGNASQVDGPIADSSPLLNVHEGDPLPRQEDPSGHSSGVRAPGGTVVRVSLDGKTIERFAGGIRNAYDLVFNERGDLFVHDSDMESDVGLPWYRPTQLYHVPPGADLGWRSGWSKFPEYYEDTIPPIAKTGRGSPTGATLYQHFQYPMAYQNALFLGDWSEGRILKVSLKEKGSSYESEPEVFVTGRPGNVVDLDVGQDGSLYFCTGGRGTAGGVFRVVWKGQIPPEVYTFNNDLERVIRHPQPTAAWARQNLALLKQRMGPDWETSLLGVLREPRNDVSYRLRALDLMVLYGPWPTASLLDELTTDERAEIRARATDIAGQLDSPVAAEMLKRAIADADPMVRRCALQSCIRRRVELSLDDIRASLQSMDRVESTVARRCLERIPVANWRDEILTTDDQRLFVQGSLALVSVQPTEENRLAIIERTGQLLQGFISDANFIDILRVCQVALDDPSLNIDSLNGFAQQIAAEFPAGVGVINRQLAILLARLQVPDVDGRMKEFFASESFTDLEKLDVAMRLHVAGAALNDDVRLQVLEQLEAYAARFSGGGYRQYLDRAIQQMAATLTDEQIPGILEQGERFPVTTVAALYRLQDQIDESLIERLIEIDRRVVESDDMAIRRLRLGIIGMLGASREPRAMEYLRQIWKERPKYRGEIAIGLAQQPEEENWGYLVSSLPVLDDTTAVEVLKTLQRVDRRPTQPEPFRDVIVLGWKLRNEGADAASGLLQHWAGVQPETTPVANEPVWKSDLRFWKNWFEQKWQGETVELDESAPVGEYSQDQILGWLETGRLGDPNRGRAVFAKANCAACHRLAGFGEAAGPELTNLGRRFSTREILEAITQPSRVIPDRFRSRKILTSDGKTHVGMVSHDADGSVLLLDIEGQKIRFQPDEIEEMADAELSAMPDGLLNGLDQEEIIDLFAFLQQDSDRQARAPSEPQH